jgi:hypothetical protein
MDMRCTGFGLPPTMAMSRTRGYELQGELRRLCVFMNPRLMVQATSIPTFHSSVRDPSAVTQYLPPSPRTISPSIDHARRNESDSDERNGAPTIAEDDYVHFGNEEDHGGVDDWNADNFDEELNNINVRTQIDILSSHASRSPSVELRPRGRRTKAKPASNRLASAIVRAPPSTPGTRLSPGQVLQHTFRLDDELFAFVDPRYLCRDSDIQKFRQIRSTRGRQRETDEQKVGKAAIESEC